MGKKCKQMCRRKQLDYWRKSPGGIINLNRIKYLTSLVFSKWQYKKDLLGNKCLLYLSNQQIKIQANAHDSPFQIFNVPILSYHLQIFA